MINYEAAEGKMAREWHSRFEDPMAVKPEPNEAQSDFNHGIHAETFHATNGEVVFNIDTHRGIPNPNTLDHFIDPYTDLAPLAPEPQS